MREPHRGRDQDIEHRLLFLDVVGQEGPLETEPGIVDEQVDRPVGVGQPALDLGQLGAVGEVGHERLHRDAVRRRQLLCHVVETGGVAGHQHQVVAAVGQLSCELVPDAGGAAGDQRDSPARPDDEAGEEAAASDMPTSKAGRSRTCAGRVRHDGLR